MYLCLYMSGYFVCFIDLISIESEDNNKMHVLQLFIVFFLPFIDSDKDRNDRFLSILLFIFNIEIIFGGIIA